MILSTSKSTARRLVAAAALALAITAASSSPVLAQVTEQNVAAKIAAAKTPADHEAIAAFYKSEASAAAAKVKTHEAMAASYKTAGKFGPGLADHCQTLIREYTAAEKDYTKMAEEHEALAKSAK